MATKHLLVASTEACSGKSATIVGIAGKLQAKGIKIAYTQPVVTASVTDSKSTLPLTTAGDAGLMASQLACDAEIGQHRHFAAAHHHVRGL